MENFRNILVFDSFLYIVLQYFKYQLISILPEILAHGNHVFWGLGAFYFFPLHCHEYLIRNDGLMGPGIEIRLHEAIIFNLDCASADCLLE